MSSLGSQYYKRAVKEAAKKRSDDEKAFKLFEKAIAYGSMDALYAVGTWYLNGYYVKLNIQKGMSLIRKAARANQPLALFTLALSYEVGKGVRKKNPGKALGLYMRSALYGHSAAFFEVGRMYFYGIGVRGDRELARAWMLKAEELGYKD